MLLSLTDSVFRKAQEGASFFFSKYTSQDSVFGKPQGVLLSLSLSQIVYLEKPRRVLLLIML